MSSWKAVQTPDIVEAMSVQPLHWFTSAWVSLKCRCALSYWFHCQTGDGMPMGSWRAARAGVLADCICRIHISPTTTPIHTNFSFIEASPCVTLGVHCHIYSSVGHGMNWLWIAEGTVWAGLLTALSGTHISTTIAPIHTNLVSLLHLFGVWQVMGCPWAVEWASQTGIFTVVFAEPISPHLLNRLTPNQVSLKCLQLLKCNVTFIPVGKDAYWVVY